MLTTSRPIYSRSIYRQSSLLEIFLAITFTIGIASINIIRVANSEINFNF